MCPLNRHVGSEGTTKAKTTVSFKSKAKLNLCFRPKFEEKSQNSSFTEESESVPDLIGF